MKFSLRIILFVCVFLSSFNLYAAAIIDPDNDGSTGVVANGVLPNGTIFDANSFTSSPLLRVGFIPNSTTAPITPGVLELNADSGLGAENSIVATNHTQVLVSGISPDGSRFNSGELRVNGDDTSGSASLTAEDFRVGGGPNARLEITNGGLVETTDLISLGNALNFEGAFDSNTEVVIDGAGSILHSSFSGSFRNVNIGGLNGTTQVTISNGGAFEVLSDNLTNGQVHNILFGSGSDDATAKTIINVDGGSSSLSTNGGSIFSTLEFDTVDINVSNGGKLSQSGELTFAPDDGISFGGSLTPNGSTITVSGASSTIEAEKNIDLGSAASIVGFTASGEARSNFTQADNSTVVGDQVFDTQGNPLFDQEGNPILFEETSFGSSTSIVLYPDSIDVNNAENSMFRTKRTSTVIVENGGALTTQGDINISVEGERTIPLLSGQDSILTLNNGSVSAVNINVSQDGTLNGIGSIVGDVQINGGTLSPGNSPGTLNIDGDLNLNSGFLRLESLGGETDLINVTGDINIGEDALIELLFDFDPESEAIVFEDFFGGDAVSTIAQNFDPLTNVRLLFTESAGVNIDDEFDFFLNGQQFLLLPSSVTAVPVPAAVWLFGSALIGLVSLNRKRI